MKFNTLLLQVTVILAVYAPSASLAKPTPAPPAAGGITISAGPDKTYSWTLPDMPSSLQKLSKPLALKKPLTGSNEFDIVLESSLRGKGKGKSKKQKRSGPNRLDFNAEAAATDVSVRAATATGSVSPFAPGERVLRSLYPAGSYARSGDKHASFVATPLPEAAFAGPKSRYIRLEYQMMFEPGFKWVKGGKLPGILMGSELGCNA
ncbi:hypothetical protein BGZ97_006341, partial [Linnemannia gamsii]